MAIGEPPIEAGLDQEETGERDAACQEWYLGTRPGASRRARASPSTRDGSLSDIAEFLIVLGQRQSPGT